MLGSDVSALDELLAPELIFTSHLGQLVGKEDDLAAHRLGLIKVSALEYSDRHVRLIGDVAIVSVRARLSGTFAGNPASGDFRFTRVWALSPRGTWQVVAGHADVVA